MTTLNQGLPKEFPCPICGEFRKLPITKKDKPYLTCNDCGVQLFIRGESGVSRLRELNKNPEVIEKIKSLSILDTSKLIRINHETETLNLELKKLNKEGFWGETPTETIKARKSKITKKLDELNAEYDAVLLQSKITVSEETEEV